MSKKIFKSTAIVAMSTMLSRVLGFIRDMIIANYFGASAKLDGFFVAFRIPNLFRRLVGEGALTISFVPVYLEYLETKGKKEALQFAQKIFVLLAMVLLFICVTGIYFSKYIVKLFAYGFDNPEVLKLTISLNQWMFPYLFLIAIVAFAMGVLNSHRSFFAPAFSPVLLNVGFICGAVIFSSYFEEPLYGLAIGVLLGGMLQILLQIPYLIKVGFKVKITFDFNHPGVKKMFKMMIPLIFGAAVYQVNILVNTVYASTLPEGSISYLYYSDRLTEIIMGVFIVSIGSVVLPEMSSCTVSNKTDQFKSIYLNAISGALYLAIPAAVALMIIGFPIISVLFMRGAFSENHAQSVYSALFFASLGIVPMAVARITLPAFYSTQDSKTPFRISIFVLLINASLGYFLKNTVLKHAGLSLANAIAVIAQVLLLLYFFVRKFGKLNNKQLWQSLYKQCIASAIMGIFLYYASSFIDWAGISFAHRLAWLVLIIVVGSFIYLLFSYFLKIREFMYIKNILTNKK